MEYAIGFMLGFTVGGLGMFIATLIVKYIWNPDVWKQREKAEFLSELADRINSRIEEG